MAISPNTQIRLLKVPFEIDNKNQLTFSQINEQTDYFTSLPNIEIEECSYQRKNNIIRFPEHIDKLLNYNYVMYKNNNYSNKWFYAFIIKMEYNNDGLTDITIQQDTFQTWQFDIIYKEMFVEREHVLSDNVGEHTIPENLETGEYISNQHLKDTTMETYAKDLCYVMASTSLPLSGEAKDTIAPSGKYNGIYTGLSYFRYDSENPIDIILSIFAQNGKTDAINGIFMCPKWLAPLKDDLYRSIENSDLPQIYEFLVPKNKNLNGYEPINKKLLCFPYNYLLVSNNIGQNEILHYEKFSDENNATFEIKGVINPGCSINITPTDYNGNEKSDNDSLSLGKFPICNFQNDMYTNWLTQNSINLLGQNITTDDLNIAGSIIGAGSSLFTNVASGNFLGAGLSITSGFQGIISSLIQQKQHNMIPPSISGQLNNADVNVASGNNTFHFYKMSIKKEYAKIIDDFFSMFGYKVNSIKKPNITGRKNWNYVKTIDANIIGDIPQEDLQQIKEIFNNGVTFWHNSETFLDYSQDNSII